MTLDDAITHCKEVMMQNLERAKNREASDPGVILCLNCAEEHRQFAEWLQELKNYRERMEDDAK